MKKIRADELLFLQGKAESRSQAKILIMAGKVRSGPDSLILKPAQMLSEDAILTVDVPMRFVSRGGEKIDGAIKAFNLDFKDKIVLDVGASTGGFTDCVLQAGAKNVVCVDVGHGQLHWKIANDERVFNFEKINARNLDDVDLPFLEYDFVIGDLSFISLTKILIPAWNRVKANGFLVMLIKPQFEATREEVSAVKGIIKDTSIHSRVVDEILTFSKKNLEKFNLIGVCESPIHGGDGNVEFLFCGQKGEV